MINKLKVKINKGIRIEIFSDNWGYKWDDWIKDCTLISRYKIGGIIWWWD